MTIFKPWETAYIAAGSSELRKMEGFYTIHPNPRIVERFEQNGSATIELAEPKDKSPHKDLYIWFL